MIYVCILCLLLLALSYVCSNESILAPAVIVSGVWFVTTFLFLVLDHNLNPATSKFMVAISIWVATFCISSLLAQSLKFNISFANTNPSQIARDIYFYFSLITLPFFLHNIYIIISSGFGENIFSVLRYANVSGFENKGIAPTTSFFVIFWLVSYSMELINYSKQNRWRVILLFILNLLYAFISMSKANFLTLFLVTIIILFYKEKIKLKTILIGLMLLIVVFFSIQTLRRDRFSTKLDTKDFVSLYLLAGIPAFETLEPESSEHFGESTLRLFYAINYKLGYSQIEPEDPILKFVHVPIGTNVYTTLYPYYKDFGLTGVTFFGLFLGFLFGVLYNKLRQKDQYALILYALLSICVAMQFMNEVVFTTLSQNLQYIIIAYIPFLISRYHLFERKTL